MVVLREVIGGELRRRRQDQGRTLRDVSSAAAVSLGYLSEVERGQKEASSELLSAICEALDAPLSTVLADAARKIAVMERKDKPARSPVTVGSPHFFPGMGRHCQCPWRRGLAETLPFHPRSLRASGSGLHCAGTPHWTQGG